MNTYDDLEMLIKSFPVTTSEAVDQRILAAASVVLEDSSLTLLESRRSSVWRDIMRSKWTKLAAAILVVATIGTVTFHRQTATVAYALEDTLAANRGLRYTHIRIEPAGEGLGEAWAQFDENGNLFRLRMHFPNSQDGDKQVLWQQGKAEVWFKSKGHVLVINEQKMAEKIAKELRSFDPKATIEQLYQAEAEGILTLETRHPDQDDAPIQLVATYKQTPNKRDVYLINPQTKLVEQVETFQRENDQWLSQSRRQYLDYNQNVPENTFVLDLPAEVTRVDWTTQEVGLAQGELTDQQIATKVAREFFEALIKKDYKTAGKLFSGMPASRMEQAFQGMDFLKIISVGDVSPHPNRQTRFLQVNCEVEIRVDGEVYNRKFTPLIRSFEGQPGRWGIDGGI